MIQVKILLIVILLCGCFSGNIEGLVTNPAAHEVPAVAVQPEPTPLERLAAIFLDVWQSGESLQARFSEGYDELEKQGWDVHHEAIAATETALPLVRQLGGDEVARELEEGIRRARDFMDQAAAWSPEERAAHYEDLGVEFSIFISIEDLAFDIEDALRGCLAALADADGDQVQEGRCLSLRMDIFVLVRQDDRYISSSQNGCRRSGVAPPDRRLEAMRDRVAQLHHDARCLREFAGQMTLISDGIPAPEHPSCVEEALESVLDYVDLRGGNEETLEETATELRDASTPTDLERAASQLAREVESLARDTHQWADELQANIELIADVRNRIETILHSLLLQPQAVDDVRQLIPGLTRLGFGGPELIELVDQATESCSLEADAPDTSAARVETEVPLS